MVNNSSQRTNIPYQKYLQWFNAKECLSNVGNLGVAAELLILGRGTERRIFMASQIISQYNVSLGIKVGFQ